MSSLWAPAFPSADLVQAAGRLLTAMPSWDGREGPRARLIVGPGCVAISRTDPARAERSSERRRHVDRISADLAASDLLLEHRQAEADAALLAAGTLAASGLVDWSQTQEPSDWADHLAGRIARRESPATDDTARSISAWSSKSRANMVKTLAQLDYAPLFSGSGLPGMLTLTYPGDWLPVAPSAAACKRHVDTFKRRYLRQYGTPLVGVWKREFQRRGAPHYHVLMVPPPGFASWAATAWAEIVGAESCGAPEPLWGPGPDGRRVIVCCERHRHVKAGTGVDYAEGMRARDPKRLAVYFSKHGAYSAKDYQNHAPEEWTEAGSVGRFWGVWGLDRALATVEVSPVEALAAARTLRRWQRANGYRVQRTVFRTDTRTGEIRTRRSGVWVGARMRGSAGFVVVNDGAAVVSTLVRYLDQVRESAQDAEISAWLDSPARLRTL